MKIKMNRTLTVPEELANLLRQLADIFEEDEVFTQACFVICSHGSDFLTESGWVDVVYEKGK